MTRTPRYDKISGVKRGTWTPDEDSKLIAYVTKYGHWNWSRLPKFAGLARCGKSCRLRWMNYLRPNIKRGNYSQEEEQTIIKLHEKLGNRWSAIAAHLPGRSDNDIKNHWHATLKKRFPHSSVTDEKAKTSKSKNKTPIETRQERDSITNNVTNSQTSVTYQMDVTPLSAHSSPGEFSCIIASTSNENLVLKDDFTSQHNCTEPISSYFWTDPYLVDCSYVPGELLAVTNTDYLNPVHDAELWSTQNSLYENYSGIF